MLPVVQVPRKEAVMEQDSPPAVVLPEADILEDLVRGNNTRGIHNMKINKDEFGDFFEREVTIYSIRSNIISLNILLDTSGSMSGKRITEVNAVMSNLMDLIKEIEESYSVQVRFRAIQFNSVANWVLGDTEHYVCNYHFCDYAYAIKSQVWIPLIAEGTTATAEAIALASAGLHHDFYQENTALFSKYEHDRLYYHPPVIVLVTDGLNNDPNRTLKEIEKLKHSVPIEYEERVMRIAIGIGGADLDELKQFASIGEIEHGDGTTSEETPLVVYLQDEEGILTKTYRASSRVHFSHLYTTVG